MWSKGEKNSSIQPEIFQINKYWIAELEESIWKWYITSAQYVGLHIKFRHIGVDFHLKKKWNCSIIILKRKKCAVN